MNSLDRTRSLEILTWDDIVHMDSSMSRCASWEGVEIADAFNIFCDYGMEIEYIEDSMWRFQNLEEANRAMDAIDYQDQKRCSD